VKQQQTKQKEKFEKQIASLHIMSSLSRRACYKCGNVGHYAEVCSSSERLCYNCKQPGHESNNCPHPRTTDSESRKRLSEAMGYYS
jgi:hypothetical protein